MSGRPLELASAWEEARRSLAVSVPSGLVAVAYSGGADSTALLGLALEAFGPERVLAAHANDSSSPNSDAWAAFCSERAKAAGCRWACDKFSSASEGKGPEAASRRKRREFLSGLGAAAILFGHHKGDQAETVLLNLCRGAGLAGASGMSAESLVGGVPALRPFLTAFSADDLRTICREKGWSWVEDETNADVGIPRNRIRSIVLPELSKVHPGAAEGLVRAGEIFAEAEAIAVERAAEDLEAAGLEVDSEGRDASVGMGLERLSPARRRSALRALAGAVGLDPPRRAVTEFDKIVSGLAGGVSAGFSGGQFRIWGDRLWAAQEFVPRGEASALEDGSASFAGRFWVFDSAGVDLDGARLRWSVAGDRLAGASAAPKSLSELLRTKGTPPWRRSVPCLAGADGTLLWAQGCQEESKVKLGASFEGAGALKVDGP